MDIKNYTRLFFGMLFFYQFVEANSPSTTSTANQLWKKGNVAFQQYEHESSLTYLNQALTILEEEEQWSEYVLVLCKIAENLDKLERFEEMKQASEQAVEVGCKYLEENERALGQAYHLLGESYWVEAIFNIMPIKNKQKLLKEAIHYFDIAEGIFIVGEYWKSLIENHLNMSFVRIHLESDFNKSDSYSKSAIRLVKEKFPKEDSLQYITLSQAYSHLSKNQVRFLGDFDKAIEYANLSLENRLQLPNKLPKDKEWLVGKYLQMGGVHARKNDKEQAYMYFKKAEALVEDIGDIKIKYYVYHSMSFRNFYFEDYESAIVYGRKSLEVVESPVFSPKGLQEELRFQAYCFLANQYFLTNQLDSANYLMDKIEDCIKKNTIEVEKNGLLNTYFSKAVYEKNQGQLDKALQTMKPCIEILETLPLVNLQLSYSYSWWSVFLAEIYVAKGDYIRALEYHQKSVYFLSYENISLENFGENPSVEDVALKTFYLKIMHKKAKTLREYYLKENQDQEILEAAFETYSLVIEGIDVVRQEYLAEDSKKWLGENTLDLYEEGIVVSLDLYELTQDSYYQEQFFLFSEKSKASLLIETISDRQIKSAYLSKDLLEKEKQLQINLAFYEKLLYKEGRKDEEKQDSLKMELWKEKVFQLERSKELFYQLLKDKYPKYFDLKYSSKTVGVGGMKKMLLDNEALIEFFWGEESLHILVLSSDYKGETILHTSTIKDVKKIEKQILKLIEYHKNPNCDFNEYVKASYELYSELFQPIAYHLDENITNLMIVPDGMLGYLPFEALITEPSMNKEPNYSIHNLSYLLEKYQINYSYSANLSIQYAGRSNYEILSPTNENVLIAYAPSFYGESEGLLVRSCTEDGLAKLSCAETEAQSLGAQWKGSALVGQQATKKHFLEQASKSSIVHLATHACMDDHNPNFNRIYFSNEEYLTALELYALDLKTELTVLSACNTGNGQLLKGEGIMSLARGFMAAGCPSLVTTLWGVNDCTTKNLMTHFYERLYDGESKDEALRNAKLAYLNDSETTRLSSHPFYWAAVVQLGDNRAMFKKESSSQLHGMYGLGVFFLICIFGLLNRRTL